MFLAELQADPKDERVGKLAEHVLQAQLPNGGFSASARRPSAEIVCLTANVLRSLVHFGYGDDERIIRGYRRLFERVVPHGGVPCVVLDNSPMTTCKMTLPQTLRCLAAAPPAVQGPKLKKAIRLLSNEMRDVRVYHYVRPDASDYYAALKARPARVKAREFKQAWLSRQTGSFPLDQLLPKKGWLRLGFPRWYNPDVVEALLGLAELGARSDKAYDNALDQIELLKQSDGRWKMQDSLNGRMLASIERKGKASKWVTLRALIVLTHFGRVKT
jgi:hypothetical protein